MYSRPNQLFTASMLLIVSVLCALASAHATTFSVTNLDDSGAGSLRQAVLDANAASGADVINFSVTGVITLTTEGLTITDDLELLGPGAMSLSISGNNSNIVFVNSSGVILGISGLTISEGKGDGGSGTSEDSGTIYNYGTLVINNSAVRDSIMSDCYEDGTEWCVAGVVNFGTLTMNNSSVSYNYGAEGISGIVNVGTAMINNSIIEQNSSGDALAGISNHGLLAVKDSTIRDNRGGYGDAGVVNSRFGTLTVDRSTISGNSARCLSGVFNGNEMTINTSTVSNNRGDSGGILNGNNGSLSINASTVYGNTSGDGRECEAGAGISNMPGSTLVIGNTIVAGNNRNTGDLIGPVPADVKGLFVSLGHNLVGNADESSGFGSSGDQLGTLAAPLDPLLGPLQNNGGPTETHALLSGSSAIDMGSNSLLPPHTITDQRGFLRIVNGTVDIGAYEFGDGVLPTVFAVDDGPYVLDEGSALAGHANILDNDTGPEGVPLIPVVVDPPDHASFFQVMPNGTFDYTHDGSETTLDSFTYRASDGLNESEIATVSLTINPVNDAPAFIGVLPPGLSTPEDTTLTIPVSALDIDDPDSDPSSFMLRLEPQPPNANYTLAGPASITPAENFNGDLNVRATVSDGELDSVPFLIPVTVTAENDRPVLEAEIGDRTADRATAFSLDVSANFSDADGDALMYSATGLPPSLAIGPDTGLISGTLVQSDLGTWDVTVTAKDPSAASASDSFLLTIVNNDPVFTGTPLTAATEGVLYSYTVTTEDIDGDLVAITGTVVPAWLTLTDNGDDTATLSGTAVGADVGDHPVDLLADDGNAGTATQQFTITVTASGEGPVITLLGDATVTINVGDTYTDAGATASDPQDGDLTAQIVVDNPVDTSTGGIYTVTYTVEDSVGNAAQAQRIVIVDGPPIITLIGAATVKLTEGDTYIDAGARAIDREDGDLTAEIVITNPVNTSRPGTYTVTYTVRDSAGNEAHAQRTVIVEVAAPPPPPPPPPIDQPPTITVLGGATVTLTAGDSYTDEGATASDPEDGDLTAQIVVDNPVDANTPGIYTVTYTVEDSGGNEVQAQRTVTVKAAPPPTPPPRTSSGGGGGMVSPFELLVSALMLLAISRRHRMTAFGRKRTFDFTDFELIQ